MADEAQVQVSLNINNTDGDNFQWRSANSGYTADVTGKIGPSPGLIVATTAGVSVTFTGLTTPGFCVLTNLDGTNFVEYGIWDGATFHELGELLPDSQPQLIRLSRNMTGFRLKADTASCNVRVEAFED